MSLRTTIKEKLHGAHTGIQSCLRRARETVYWPGMNSDLTDHISKCDICSSYQSNQAREPLISHEVADRPWQKIGADVFTLHGTDYLCVVDYYSSYFEVDRLESKTAKGIAKILRKQFSVHGIPNQLISDNMPFNSLEFREFSASHEFEVITSSPGYPQSNGKAKNAIKTAKSIMKKAKKAGTDPYLSLLDWRNTPSKGMSSSPAQRMFGRRTRTLLPTTSYLLKPKVEEDVKEKLLKQKSRQAKYYNQLQNTKELPPLQTGEVVRVAPKPGDRERNWFKARVEDQVDIRSYQEIINNLLVLTKSEQKMVESTEETVTSANLRNHLFRLLNPVQCDRRRTTTLTERLPQLNQLDPSLPVNQSKTTLLINPSKQNLSQISKAKSHHQALLNQ